MGREADVVVVGAGLSGLIAAREVLAAGREPVIIEANDRVGGRILTAEPIAGVPVELGAQWIGDTHHRMEALAADLGVEIFDQFEEGETSYEFAGGLLREAAFHAKYGDELAGVERVLREIDRMAETVLSRRRGWRPRPTPGTGSRSARGTTARTRPGRPHAARDLHRGDLVGAHRGGVAARPALQRAGVRGER